MQQPQSPEARRAALDRVLASADFSRSPRQSAFLRFLVERHLEGRDSELKESVIAIEVFGRPPDYDPKVDATVRTEAVRLRARLDRYYAGEGSDDSLVIELPKGAYRPVFRERASVAPRLTASDSRPRVAAVAAIALALVGGGAAWLWARTASKPFQIAVLPLEDLAPAEGHESVADGLTDEIIFQLAAMDGLDVRSRTSSFALKGKHLTTADAGQQLRADYLVEGSVQAVGGMVRVNAAVIRVRDDSRVWSGRFDKTLTNVLAIQDEISSGIAGSLRVTLRSGQRHYERDAESFELYQRGRQVMEGFPAVERPVALDAIRYYQQAADKTPEYAIAYAGIADAFLAMDENVGNLEAYRRARVAADRAVTIDPALSEAQSAAAALSARDYAWQDAERGFRRAIELNPNNALAHLRLGSVLVVQGRVDDGLAEERRAVELDPLSASISTETGRSLLLAGRFDEAARELRRAIQLDLGRNRAYGALAQVLALQGKAADAQAVLDDAIRNRAVRSGTREAAYPCVKVLIGRREETVAALADELALMNAPAGTPIDVLPFRDRFDADMRGGALPYPARRVAETYACLGDESHAVEYLEQAVSRHEAGLAELVRSPQWAWLRSNPQVASLKRKLNLPS